MTKDKWIWMPHAGHFIGGRDCRFHLNTYVGGYIVSTVGEYEPAMVIREIEAKCLGIKLEGKGDSLREDALLKLGYTKIGLNRIYETMVFKAKRSVEDKCCRWTVSKFRELDFKGYNKAEDALKGHMELCKKWANKK